MSILGNRVLRREDPKLLTVGGTYVADLDLPDSVHLSFVRSSMAHAKILSVDTSAAKTMPGVVAVYTNEDLAMARMPTVMGMTNAAMTPPMLASGTVRYVGEPIVAIIADTREIAADALEQVVIEYDPLSVVIDPVEARKDETILFPDAGTNTSFALDFGGDEALFDECDVVVELTLANQRVAPCPMEGRSAAGHMKDGRLEFNSATQAPHRVRDAIAGFLNLEPEDVHVVTPDVGGGFGAKASVYPEDIVVGWCAQRLGRPVRWTETRSESMVGLGHGRAQIQHVRMGGTRDGVITAYRIEVLQDSGAYPAFGTVLPFMTRIMTSGPYRIPKAEFTSVSVVTNSTPTVAYRGAGRPEATAAIERIMDVFAREIAMDPAELRRRNLIDKDEFPYTTPVETVYDVGDYHQALELALEVAGYDDLRAQQFRRRASRDVRQLGIGVSCYVEITNGLPDGEFGAVEVRPDGKIIVRTGTSPHGQGHVTAWSMLVAEQLGVSMEDIEVLHGDTDIVPRGAGTMGSRSLQIGGAAVNQAAVDVVEKAKDLAADLFEADREDIVFDKSNGIFHVVGTPAVSRSWGELARAAVAKDGKPLFAEVDLASPGPTFPFGAHLSVVEVDTETGKVTLLRHIAVDDAGTIVNPLLAEGQVHGGIAQGVAQALLEEVVYDLDGNPLTSTLADYSMISAAELPSFETRFTETPTPINALGAKGIGESGTIGSTPAVHNAVCDAVAHLGVRHIDMPTTPIRVWNAINEAMANQGAAKEGG
ncbi:MAG TPA: xanthine dehydrogenase family protein molybdopterin-binding subunit [Acidimicrobiales bacterium]|nr:xanthine dehydrogenase family protein molybdopterin-binding subunit [Acidimicrobiales bacterium]